MGAHKLNDNAMRKLGVMERRTIGRLLPQGEQSGAQQSRGREWFWAKTTSSISIGTLSVPTTFTFSIWFPDPASMAAHPPFIVSPDARYVGLTGVNRSSMATANGAMIKVEYAYGEWTPMWIDC